MRTAVAALLIFHLFAATYAVTEPRRSAVLDSAAFLDAAGKRPVSKRRDEAQIDALLRRMTIEEKVGQMTQLTIDMVTRGKDQN